MRVPLREFLRSIALVVIASFVVAALAFGPAAADDDEPEVVPQEILAELVPGADPQAVAARYAIALVDGIETLRVWLYRAPEGVDTENVISAMESDPEIVSAEVHYVIDNPEGGQRTIGSLDRQASMDDMPAQPAFGGIGGDQAVTRHTGRGVTVALLDTGISYRHEYVRRNVRFSALNFADGVPWKTTAQPDGIDNDGDGFVDEGLGHATYVAGLIRLVAPDVAIVPIRVLDEEGRGTAFSLANGLMAALASGADIVNLSLGMTVSAQVVDRALAEANAAGMIVVAAAGNRDREPVDYPGSFESALTVAAVDDGFVKSAFSSYGDAVDVSAPGVSLLSAHVDEGYSRSSGTSFSAPLLTGAIALLLERYPALTPVDVVALVRSSAQPDGSPDYHGLLGAGTLDAAALTLAVTADRTSVRARHDAQGTVVSRSPVEGALAHDVIRGDVRALRAANGAIDLGAAVCIGNDLPHDAVRIESPRDAALPAAGEAFFYLYRDDAAPADAPFGRSSSGAARVVGAGGCA